MQFLLLILHYHEFTSDIISLQNDLYICFTLLLQFIRSLSIVSLLCQAIIVCLYQHGGVIYIAMYIYRFEPQIIDTCNSELLYSVGWLYMLPE